MPPLKQLEWLQEWQIYKSPSSRLLLHTLCEQSQSDWVMRLTHSGSATSLGLRWGGGESRRMAMMPGWEERGFSGFFSSFLAFICHLLCAPCQRLVCCMDTGENRGREQREKMFKYWWQPLVAAGTEVSAPILLQPASDRQMIEKKTKMGGVASSLSVCVWRENKSPNEKDWWGYSTSLSCLLLPLHILFFFYPSSPPVSSCLVWWLIELYCSLSDRHSLTFPRQWGQRLALVIGFCL